MFTIKFNVRAGSCVLAFACVGLLLAGCGSHGSVSDGAGYMADGKYRAAYIEAKKVLQNDPDNGKAWLLLGKATLMQGNPKDALTDLEKARANGVSIEHWAVPMGRALRATHQYDKLLKELPADQVLTARPKSRVAVLRGDALRGLGQTAPAEKAYQAALKLDPDNPRALVGLSSLAMLAGDHDAARSYVQRAVVAAPQSPEAWVGKAALAYAERDFAGAESAYNKALGIKAHDWLPQERFMARLRLAGVQVQLKQYDKALASIEALEKMAPQVPEPHYLHAVVLYRQGHLDDVVEQLQKVLQVSPDDVHAQLLMGAVNYAKGNYGQAEMYLSNVMGMDRGNVAARKLLALTYYREGRSDQALQTLRPVVAGKVPDAALLAQLQRAVAHGAAEPSSTGNATGAGNVPPMAAVATMASIAHDSRFAGAREALKRGDATKAIDLLKAMPKGDASTETQRATLLVMAYASDKHVDEAIKTAADRVAAHPDDSGAHLLYGTALVAGRQYDKARAQYKKATELDADNLAARLNLGSLDVLEHHYKDAEGHYKAVLQQHPDNAVALTALGKLAVIKNDHADAIKWFQRAINAAPKFTLAYFRLIALYSQSGQFDQAVDVATQLVKAMPDNPAALNALGAVELNAGHPDKALQPLQQAVKMAPGEGLYRINLARAQVLLKHTKAAQDNLEQVVKTHPDRVKAVALLAAMKLHDKDLPGALALAHMLQQQSSTKVAGYALEGDLYMASKSYDKAAAAYQRGLQAQYSRPLVVKHFLALRAAGANDPAKGMREWLAKHTDDASIRMLLANYYMGSAQHRLAVDQYERVLKAYPSNIIALNNLAWLYVEQDNPKALALAKQAHGLSPGTPGIADTYAWALLAANQPDDALPLLQKAAKAAPKMPTIQYHLALAQARSGNRADARATLEGLNKSDASFPERKAAQTLYRKLAGTAGGGESR